MPRGIYQRPPSKATPKTIRTLRPGEPRPDGEPRRFADRDGYVRLRWHVGTNEYVELREHRAIAGDATDHVHHLNHDPSDNRPGNLIGLSKEDHAALHGAKRRKFDRGRAADLYAAGLSTPEIGRVFGVDHSNVYRALRKMGVQMRGTSDSKRKPIDEHAVLRLHDAGERADAIARTLGSTTMVVRRVLREHGRRSHPAGRPPNR